MTVFRPCIDLHSGQVKQIVGSSLGSDLKENYVSLHSSAYYASLYRENHLKGCHLIMLGPGNEQACMDALAAYPNAIQVGGGITLDNCMHWLGLNASHVIVTSFLFPGGKFSLDRLKAISKLVGRDRLVVDLSCKRVGDSWIVAMNKWQTLTDMALSKGTFYNAEILEQLSEYCCEFLVHAADVEGLCQGIDELLVQRLAEWSPIPCTYAGGGKSLSDLDLVKRLSHGKVDLTFGSALDIFGGTLVRFQDAVEWNKLNGSAE